jgi:phenylalanyl-tRNA synthetase beta chain
MLVSYKWLQTYFDESLPAPEKLAELFTMRVFEVDDIKRLGEDTLFDLKILPDRAHYCLSHRGVAGEISAITGLLRTAISKEISVSDQSVQKPSVTVEDEECGRYIARRIEGVTVSASPDWLVERLRAIGQKSINNIVDATNFVMFDMGQPLHAFDADKLSGGITVRKAREGERITTLDGKDVVLTLAVLVIADDEGPLAIAGIKGGTRAQVDEHTKNIILEAAYFKPSSTRKTSMALQIRTDASKRFENGLTPEYAPVAMKEVTALLLKESHSLPKAGPIVDIYPEPAQQTVLSVRLAEINKRLGVEVPRSEAIAMLRRLSIDVVEKGEQVLLTIPFERLDLAIPEDIVEEVGRLHGYEKIKDQLLPPGVAPVIDKRNYYVEKVRDILQSLGFSEVYLYSLGNWGDFEIELPLSEDKKFLRVTLIPGMAKALALNVHNAPLLGMSQIKIFEFGNVFLKDKEVCMLAVGVENTPRHTGMKPAEEIKEVLEKLLETLGLPTSVIEHLNIEENRVVELAFDELVKKLPEPPQEPVHYEINRTAKFQKFSPYPFVARDIAIWVGRGTAAEEIESVLKEAAGRLLIRATLFDEYRKDDRVSYAFWLVFQSHEKTLTNEEVNTVMNFMVSKVKKRNWEVR